MIDWNRVVGIPERKVRIPQLAKLLGVTVFTVRYWIKQGKLTVHRVSERVSYIDLDEVERMIASNSPQAKEGA